MPSRKGPITSPLDPNLSGLVFRPQQQILPNRGAGGGSRNINEWADLAEGLGQLGSGAGNTLLRMLGDKRAAENELEAEQLKIDEAEGRSLAFKEGLKLRKHGKKALAEAERNGLFNGLRPDVRNSFAASYGANLAKDETFDAFVSKDFNQVLRKAADDQLSAGEFQTLIRDHMAGKVEEMLREVPDNFHARDRGFIPIAEQKVNALMVKAQADYAKLISRRYVESVEKGLYHAFESSHSDNVWDPVSGLNVGVLADNLDLASEFFSTGRFATERKTGRFPDSREAHLEVEFEVFDAPKDTLPVELNRHEFYFGTYQKWLTNKILSEDHPKHLKSVQSALDALSVFYEHKPFGTGTPMSRTDQVDSMDQFKMELVEKKLKAEKNYDAVVTKATTEAKSFLSSLVLTVGPRWVDKGVVAPDGRDFDLAIQSHADWFLDQAANNRLTLDGPAPELPEGNPKNEERFGFKYEEGNPYGPPSQIIADQLSEGLVFRSRGELIRSTLGYLTQRAAFKNQNFNKVKLWKETKEKSFIEAGIKNLIESKRLRAGVPLTREFALEISQEFEGALDKIEIEDKNLANVEGISVGGRVDFSIDSVLKTTLGMLKEYGYTPVDENTVLSDLANDVAEIDVSYPNHVKHLKKKIQNHPSLTLIQKKGLLTDLDQMGESFGKAIDLNNQQGKAYKAQILEAIVAANPSIALLNRAIQEQGGENQKDLLNLANAQLNTFMNPMIRKAIIDRARLLHKHGISIQDAQNSGDWREVVLSSEPYEMKDGEGNPIKINGILQDVVKDLNTPMKWDEISEESRKFIENNVNDAETLASFRTNGISIMELAYLKVK